MAIDTKVKRWGMRSFASGPIPTFPPFPDGTIDAGDRLHLLGLYPGIDVGEPTAGITEHNVFSDNYSMGGTVSDTTTSTDLTVIGLTHFVLKRQCTRFSFNIKTSGGEPIDLSGFELEIQTIEDGDWVSIQSAWGTTDDESGFVIHTTDVLETLIHNTRGYAILGPLGIWALRFKSKLATVPSGAVTRDLEFAATKK